MYDPISATIGAIGLIGGGAASIAGNAIGARAQEGDLTAAQKTQRQYLDLLSSFKDTVYGGGQQFRDAISSLLPNLINTATSPQTSAGYQTALKEGLDLISGNAATSGDPNSGPAQIAKGKFAANLATNEVDRIMSNIFNLFTGLQGASQSATTTAANLLTGMASPYQNISDLYAKKGENTGAFWGSTGDTVSQIFTGGAGGLLQNRLGFNLLG